MTYILIADDEHDILLLMRRKLEISGFSDIWTAEDGQEALEKALSDPPALMILDVMLPNLNGLEICIRVKNALGTEAPRVIMVSARGQPHEVLAGYEAGADVYITKPFSPGDLVAEVRRLLER